MNIKEKYDTAGNARYEPHSYVLMDSREECPGIAMTRSIGDVE